jgi:APA family basic amino acid/polyamine antiporter
VLAIILQGAVSIVIALSGTYDQILNYVVSVDFIFFGLTGLALFIFRRRGFPSAGFRTPLHPLTTLFFVAACWLVVIGTFVKSPANSAIGLVILLTGLPAWWFWSRTSARSQRL